MKKNLFCLFVCIVCHVKAQPPGCSSNIDVVGNAGQAGLYGEYFAGYFADVTTFFPSTISATNRIETNLNYTTNNWGAIVPPASGSVADANTYSSRYRGSIYIATAGTYTFYLTSDDASYLWMDANAAVYPTIIANALINDGGLHGDVTVSASIVLTAGYHNIQIQYGEQGGGNHLIFEYAATSPSIARQVVPNNILCTGFQSIAPPPGCSCTAGVTSEFYTGYFNDIQTYFTSNASAINRQDANIGFTTNGGWGNVSPPLAGSNANPDTYSSRFTGQIYIPTAGTYTFYLTSDDASYMWIDASALITDPTTASAFINDGGLHGAATVSSTISLTVGLHDFKIHFGENTGNNVCYLEYASTVASIARQTIPQTAYCSCLSTVNLPIELLDFTAEINSDKNVLLKWQTATEVNNKQFDVERSIDGISFTKIGSLPSKGINGNSMSLKKYDLIDANYESGISYYRLRQIDFDGTFKIHKIVSVNSENTNQISFNVFPNPNNGKFLMSIDGISEKNNSEINIYSIDGRLIYQANIDKNLIIENKISLNTNLNLSTGLYIANCIVDGLKFPIKIIVN